MPFTLAIFGIVLGYTWLVEPRTPQSFAAVPVTLILLLAVWRNLRTQEWGVRWNALVPGLAATTAFTLPLILVLLAAGAASGTLHERRDSLGSLTSLVLWGAAQQWVLQTVVLRELQAAGSRRSGLVAAPLLFAALHLPNPLLTALTLVGALGWCAIYDRYPNVLPLALSHALGTLALLHAFDPALTGGLRVGYAYLMRD
jgi:membrane protease YdiL (CAAX protease family)